jgi:hypothetical protein
MEDPPWPGSCPVMPLRTGAGRRWRTIPAPGRAPPDHQPTTRGLDGGVSEPRSAAIRITRADTPIWGSRIRRGPPGPAFPDRAAGTLVVGLTGLVVGDACGLVVGVRVAAGRVGVVGGRVGGRIVGALVSDGPATPSPDCPNTTHRARFRLFSGRACSSG